jgi:hypothetical protein
MSTTITPTVFYRTLSVKGWKSSIAKPVPGCSHRSALARLPPSSHMFRNPIPIFADKYHVLAIDLKLSKRILNVLFADDSSRIACQET